MNPLVLFDFDGTICDSSPHFIATINRLASQFKLKTIEEHQLPYYRNMDSRKMFEEIGLRLHRLPGFIRKLRTEFVHLIPQIDLIPGMEDVLTTLRAQELILGVATNNSKQNVSRLLERYNLNVFDYIVTGSYPSKERMLRSFFSKLKINSDHPIYFVSDEPRDVEVAKQLGIISVGVTWGFATSELLKSSEPTFLCETTNELLSILSQIE